MNFFKSLTLRAKWMMIISFAIVLAVGISVIFNQWTVRNILNEENHQSSSTNAKSAVDQVTSATSEVTIHANHLKDQIEKLTNSMSKFKL